MTKTIEGLIAKVREVASERKFDRSTMVNTLRISVSTWLALESGEFEARVANMNCREESANAKVIAKLALFAGLDPSDWILTFFPKIDKLKLDAAVGDAESKVGGQDKSRQHITKEDIDFLSLMLVQSRQPITFQGAFELLCKHR
jgi:hypothetical protein